RGIVPKVLPCVPLPLPGAPKRRKVWYFMRNMLIPQNEQARQARHPERNPGITQRCSEIVQRDLSTSLRSAQDDEATAGSTFTRRPPRSKRTLPSIRAKIV